MESNKINKVTQEEIDQLLDEAIKEEEVSFFNKCLVVCYKFPNRADFTIVGVASCIDPSNFNLEIGRQVAREKVESQLWLLEGYKKQLELGNLDD